MRKRAVAAALLVLVLGAAGCDTGDDDAPVVPKRAAAAADQPAMRQLMLAARPSGASYAGVDDSGRCLFDAECRHAGAIQAAGFDVSASRPPLLLTAARATRSDLKTAAPPALSGSASPDLLRRFQRVLSQYASGRRPEIDEIIRQSRAKSMDPSLGLAVAMQESLMGNMPGPSNKGARGVMQVLPETACRDFRECSVARLQGLRRNVDIGLDYLKRQWGSFVGSEIHAINPFDPLHARRIACVGSAYNAGPGRVEKYGCDVPFRETREYVRNVVAYAQLFKRHLLGRETAI